MACLRFGLSQFELGERHEKRYQDCQRGKEWEIGRQQSEREKGRRDKGDRANGRHLLSSCPSSLETELS